MNYSKSKFKALLEQAFRAGYESPLELQQSTVGCLLDDIDNDFSCADSPFKFIPVEVQELLYEKHIWLAGGGALRALLGLKNENYWRGDWDLFCDNKTLERLSRSVPLSPVEGKYPKSSTKVFETKLPCGKVNILVNGMFAEVEGIFNTFDMTICQVAIGQNTTCYTNTAWQDLAQKRARINVNYKFRNVSDVKRTKDRLEKYKKRGFNVTLATQFLKSCVDVSKLPN